MNSVLRSTSKIVQMFQILQKILQYSILTPTQSKCFPVNIAQVLRTFFLQNTYGGSSKISSL